MFNKLLPMIVALTALPAGATTIYAGGDLSSFNAAISALGPGFVMSATHTFASVSSASTVTDVDSTGVNFLGIADGQPAMLTVDMSTLSLAASGMPNTYIRIDFPTAVYGVSLSLQGNVAKTWSYSVGSTNGTIAVSGSTPTFFGVVSDTPLPSLFLKYAAGNLVMYAQNFNLLTQSTGGGSGDPGGAEAPEPSSMALMGGALIAIPLLARRRFRK